MKKAIHFSILGLFFVVQACEAQNMKNYMNKQLMAEVAMMTEETPDSNPCAGRSINLSFVFDNDKVSVSEIEISSCDEEYVFDMGRYDWTLLAGNEIKIDFRGERSMHGYTDALFLELKENLIIGTVSHLNGTKTKHVFKEK